MWLPESVTAASASAFPSDSAGGGSFRLRLETAAVAAGGEAWALDLSVMADGWTGGGDIDLVWLEANVVAE